MRVAIIGSRQRQCEAEIVNLVNSLAPDDIVISGGCEGPDTWAERIARARGLSVIIHGQTCQIEARHHM